MADAVSEARRAGFITRFAAFLVDTIILTLSLRLSAWLLEALARAARRMAPPVDLAAVLLAVSPLIIAAYLLVFWRAIGQTPGKWLMGIKVVAADGRPLTMTQAALRVAGYLLSALPCYLGFLWVLGPNRRAWHDLLAHTDVVYVASRGSAAHAGRQIPGAGHL